MNEQVVLITGCSSGFGLVTAVHLKKKGFIVIPTMRDSGKRERLDQVLRDEKLEPLDIVTLDVTSPESVNAAVQTTLERHNRIDAVINNAGYGIGGFFEDLTDNDIREQMDTNFFGVQNVCRAVLPIMRRQKRGRIINISSVSGFTASPGFSAYAASKWALEAFSESLMFEVAPWNIAVHLVEPGSYPTEIFTSNARTATHFRNPDSPYHVRSGELEQKVKGYVAGLRKDPRDVAVLIEKLLTGRRKGLRHIPDRETRMIHILRRFLPFALFQRHVQSHSGRMERKRQRTAEINEPPA